MDTFELKKEQLKLASKVELRDDFTTVKTIGGVECLAIGNKVLASVVVCSFPSLEILEHKTYLLSDALPYCPGFTAYREMPAMIEAFNQLEKEPEVLMVKGDGVLHSRRLGLASHLGLALNKATFGVQDNLTLGVVDQGKIFLQNELLGFEVLTREHANPLYVSPGHLISFGSVLRLVKETLRFPHKMPEPLHLAHKFGKRKIKEMTSGKVESGKVESGKVESGKEVESGREESGKLQVEIKEKYSVFVDNKQEGVKE